MAHARTVFFTIRRLVSPTATDCGLWRWWTRRVIATLGNICVGSVVLTIGFQPPKWIADTPSAGGQLQINAWEMLRTSLFAVCRRWVLVRYLFSGYRAGAVGPDQLLPRSPSSPYI